MRCRVEGKLLQLADDFAGDQIDLHNSVDLVSEELNADGVVLIGRDDLNAVASHPEGVPLKTDVVSDVADADESSDQLVPVADFTGANGDGHAFVIIRGTQTVDAAHAGHNNHVSALEEGRRGSVAEPVDLVVDRCVFFDVGIGLRDVCLRLVVIVVADKVVYSVVGKELPELAAELLSQGFIVSNHQGRFLHLLDYTGHREGFAGTSCTEENLVLFVTAYSLYKFPNGLGLITFWGILAF